MKRFNKNSLLFIFFVLFIVIGLSFDNVRPILGNVKNVLVGQFTIEDAKKNIDTITSEGLTYHDFLMDCNSIKENLLGTRVVKKDDTFVVKSDSGSLIEPIEQLDKKEIQNVVKTIDDLKTVSENNGANFLYCAAPSKELYQNAPQNIDNYFKNNYDLFLSELANSNVPTINFADSLNKNELDFDTFYYTDHHWTAKSGFAANNALLKELNLRYNFEYDKEMTDLSNYNIDNYQNWFLGSKGKKVGVFFTWNGADDFDLITPKFETSFTEERPFINQTRTGVFQETVLYMNCMDKDYYKINTYATYSGGDFRLQIMKNNLNPNGKKFLLIRDSYACVVAPFLALQTGELHICDVRDYDSYVGKKLNMKDYIKQIKPDYVLVLYNGIGNSSDSRYDLF